MNTSVPTFVLTAINQFLLSLDFLSFVLEENFGDKWHRFFTDEMPFCHSSINVKAVKETQVSDSSHWPGLAWPHPFFSHHHTRLLREGALVHLRSLYDAITVNEYTPWAIKDEPTSFCL